MADSVVCDRRWLVLAIPIAIVVLLRRHRKNQSMHQPRKCETDIKTIHIDDRETRKTRTTHDTELRIIFDDGAYTVVDKPHDCRMDGDFDMTVQKMLLAKFPDRGVPKNVHQLDYATSGVMLWAYSRDAARCMAQAFEARTVSKAYLALVEVIKAATLQLLYNQMTLAVVCVGPHLIV
jgi:23S rRNA-/tRNA-specific pseudouridylate synthase